MDHQFWRDKWDQNEIGFHEANVNPMLVAHFGQVVSTARARVFVPLCGKTRDIAWLIGQGHHVVGAELSERAIKDLFDDLDLTPDITTDGSIHRYSGPSIDIFVGDIFDLTRDHVGVIDATYDRAALVALPADLRARYGPHVHDLTNGAPQLLLCFEYDQSLMNDPPFSVDSGEIARVYGDLFQIDAIARSGPVEPFRGRLSKSAQSERTVWHLRDLQSGSSPA